MGLDYAKREYLSAGEVAAYLAISVDDVHRLASLSILKARRSTSGQYRFRLDDIRHFQKPGRLGREAQTGEVEEDLRIAIRGTQQRLLCRDSTRMTELPNESVHLAITSPPYFNAKMYSQDTPGDLGNVHDLEEWFEEIQKVWGEVLRVLQPGRKFFINIMNLPIRENGTFRTLNLTGRTIDLCESLGFVFKRDIIWQKTNGVRAHFGTYPYPGGILINHMHEFILEFNKPERKGFRKYAHLSREQKEQSKLDKNFWLSIKNSDVWLMKPEKSGGNRQHVAPFPVELPLRLIKAYSFVGETILDPFAGSATTQIAAALSGRNGIGCEINPAVCQTARNRLEEANGELPPLINSRCSSTRRPC
ncbi:MAG: DNA methyltransferase [Deltaproteobacteria bacterium]|nr:DNA methyltransferase [Deltaproteobacteria bacterium]